MGAEAAFRYHPFADREADDALVAAMYAPRMERKNSPSSALIRTWPARRRLTAR